MYSLFAIRYSLFAIIAIFLTSGCVARTYRLTQDRVDQDLNTGNRGYLMGTALPAKESRSLTRTTQAVEFEFQAPFKIGKDKKKQSRPNKNEEAAGSELPLQDVSEATPQFSQSETVYMEKYKVLKGDTLQKISQKFYGTSRKWARIFDANKALKSPDKIYPGQTINIPVESLKETKENLK